MATRPFKPKQDALFNVLPFGPLNRFVGPQPAIYMESGALDLGLLSHTNPKSYLPADLYTNKQWCPINGNIYISSSLETGVDGCSKVKAEKVSGTNKLSGIKAKMKSRSFGCDKFVKELECSDPLGNVTRFQHERIPRTLIDPPFLPIAPTAGQQVSVGEAYLNWTENYLRSKNTQSYTRTITKGDSKASIEIGDLELCDCDLITKKINIRNLCKPTQYSGKARLFFQAIYGGLDDQIEARMDSMSVSITYKGVKGDTTTTAKARRLFGVDRSGTKLFTDSMGNYYLMRVSSGISLNPLEPTAEGRVVQKWLRGQNLDRKTKAIYEAYILSSCTPTRTTAIDGTSLNALSKGSELGRTGWKPNWSGTQLSIVPIDWGRPHKTYLYTADFNMNDSSQFTNDELDRKKQSIIEYREYLYSLTTMTSEDKAALVPTLKYVYIPDDNVSMTETTPGVREYCVDGDIEAGGWWWIILNDFNLNDSNRKTFEDDLESKNKIDGGMPYSKEYFTNLKSAFSMTESMVDHGEFAFKYHYHRMFTWDDMYGVYNLELSYSNKPSEINGHPGSGPVYCFYDTKDFLKVIYYVYQKNVGQVKKNNDDYSPSSCGDSWTRTSHITKNVQDYAAFIVASLEVSAQEAPSYSQSESSVDKDCGGRTGCTEPPPNPGPCNFLCCGEYWFKNYRGSGKIRTMSFSGGTLGRIALVVPKSDCEAVYLASGKFFNGSFSTFTGDYQKCVCAADMAPQRDAVRWKPCFSEGKSCYGDNCCDKIDYREPDLDTNIYPNGLGCSYMGVFYPGMKKASTPGGSVPTAGGTICTFFGHQYFAYRPSSDSYRPAYPADQCGEAWKLVPHNYGLSLDVFKDNGELEFSGNCMGGKEDPKSFTGESTSVKVYCINRSDNTLVLKESGLFGDLEDLPAQPEAFPEESKMTGAGWEWAADGKFLGWIDPMYPYVHSSVDIHQSALGLWWVECPGYVASEGFPFDKLGKHFIGAS